jgi:4-diphosphocytidyl-2-C-methyl-D-erythritol kinase
VPDHSFTLPSFAKINWFLRVLGKRDDGFHELCTVFQTVSLHDRLTFAESESLSLTCDDAKIPTGETNLVIKAAKLLQQKYSVKRSAKIHLEKRIPAPGGLGGGSSNAAAAIIGLTRLWNIEPNLQELVEIGAELGSDVPFFFFGGTALGTGRGTEIYPVKEIKEKFLLIVTPKVDVPTREAFMRLNAPHLTKEKAKSILQICRNDAEKLILRQTRFENDFETSVFAIEPEIGRVKEKLLDLGASKALLSGSGASVFAVFENNETRQATLKALEEEKNWRQFAVATVTRDQYREALNLKYQF